MRIIIFTTAYFPFVGGAELAIKEITDRLPEYSFSLVTARLRRALLRHERIGNIEIHRVGCGCFCDKWLLPLLGFLRAKKLERESKFDCAWSIMASQASIAAALFKKAFPDKKLVLTLQEGDEEEHLKRYVFGNDFLYRLFIRPWHLLVFRRADAITAISNYLAKRARRNNPNVLVKVIPNGVDMERFRIKDLRFKKEELRQRFGIKPCDKIVITTSRLVEKNGIEDLVASLRYLSENVKLLICGAGPLEFNLKLTAKRYTLNARVRFLGHISHEELPKYLHAADVFCRPALSEGMGSSFIEAMAAGLPVVATPVGGISDFLHSPLDYIGSNNSLARPRECTNVWKERITGLFARVGDPKDIAEKIKLILSNDDLRKRIIANAWKMVREKYDWGGIAEKMKVNFDKDLSRV